MSLPREVLPGRTYMITRRCSERRFLLWPDNKTTNAFIYCLAVAAQRTCWNAGPSCGTSRNCSATPRWRQRKSIRTCRSGT